MPYFLVNRRTNFWIFKKQLNNAINLGPEARSQPWNF